jgi:ABC-2 type transport system ATP-binding protein
MTTGPIELEALGVTFGDVRALDDVTLTIGGDAITGLLGRNGAGKTTLLSTVAAYRRPTAGAVRVAGRDPYEDPEVVTDIAFVPAARKADGSLSIADALGIASLMRPRWDQDRADALLERFQVPARGEVGSLSTGKRSALSITIGLASRAEVTLFDEPHLGMDAPARYAFYDELLADYVAHPRTIVVSTHLIDEIAPVIERVVILDHGRVLEHAAIDELRSKGAELTGPAEAVARLAGGRRVLSERSLGRTSSLVVFDELDEAVRREAGAAGVDVGPLPLQDLFVHLTSEEATP